MLYSIYNCHQFSCTSFDGENEVPKLHCIVKCLVMHKPVRGSCVRAKCCRKRIENNFERLVTSNIQSTLNIPINDMYMN